MSTSFRQIRKNSTAQGRFKDLVREFQRSQAQQNPIDNPDFKVKLRTAYSKLVYTDPFIHHKTKPITTVFYTPFEPDGQFLAAMWNLNHNGRFAIDSSGKGHVGTWISNVTIKEGIDNGFGTSLYTHFDGAETYLIIGDFPAMRLSFAPQFSITCRIYPEHIEASDGSGGTRYRTILHKPDTSASGNTQLGLINTGSVGNGYALAVTPDGKVRFTLVSSGIKYSVETLANVIIPSDPPFAYDIAVTCDQVNKRTIPAEDVLDPGNVLGAGDDEEPESLPPLVAPRMEIAVDDQFYALYTTDHLPMIDGGTSRRLHVGTAFPYPKTDTTKFPWFKWIGGIQQLRFYHPYILTFPQISNLHNNRITTTEMPIGSPAWAGSTLIIDPSIIAGFDMGAFDEEGFEASEQEAGLLGFPGMDPIGFDETGFDTLFLTEQGTIQGGGFDPRGFSDQGFDTIPFSQS
jgi:hypothetical protein